MAKTKEPGITKIEGAKGFHYRVQIRIKNGEHLSKNCEPFKEAKEWKLKNVAAIKSGDPYETSQMRRLTVGDLIDRFIEHELKKLRNHKTMLGHLNWLRQEIVIEYGDQTRLQPVCTKRLPYKHLEFWCAL